MFNVEGSSPTWHEAGRKISKRLGSIIGRQISRSSSYSLFNFVWITKAAIYHKEVWFIGTGGPFRDRHQEKLTQGTYYSGAGWWNWQPRAGEYRVLSVMCGNVCVIPGLLTSMTVEVERHGMGERYGVDGEVVGVAGCLMLWGALMAGMAAGHHQVISERQDGSPMHQCMTQWITEKHGTPEEAVTQ